MMPPPPLSSTGLHRGIPEMMEINPSQPLTEAFEEEEESELEEDMVSSLMWLFDLTFPFDVVAGF